MLSGSRVTSVGPNRLGRRSAVQTEGSAAFKEELVALQNMITVARLHQALVGLAGGEV